MTPAIATMSLADLPALNATLNGCATLALVAGYVMIKTGRPKAHIASMIVALILSAGFLAGYLFYHYQLKLMTGKGHVEFAGQGIVRPVYFTILFTHLVLAIVNLPMIILTVIPAASRRFDRHKLLAKWTLPIWLYVSVTGVVVYLMCYQWFGPPGR